MKQSINTTAIIVTYNSGHIIQDTLDNAPNGCPIIIVDNDSTDDTCEKVESHPRPDVHLIRNDKNAGYGTGNNIGLKHCKTRYALILNPDVEISANSIRKMKSALEQHPTAVLAGPSINNTKAIEPYPLFHKNYSLFRPILRSIFGGSKKKHYIENLSQNYECGGLLGAVMLYDLQKMPEALYFDEDIFMYCDETEWQYRIIENGYKLLLVPSAEAKHVGGASTNFDNKKDKIFSQYYNSGYSRGVLARKYAHFINTKDMKFFIFRNWLLSKISTGNRVIRYSARLQGFKDGYNIRNG